MITLSRFPSDLASLDGHFPGAPIVAGVAQLHFAMRALEELLVEESALGRDAERRIARSRAAVGAWSRADEAVRADPDLRPRLDDRESGVASDGISHFSIARDDPRLASLYVRLLGGMVLRAPELMRRERIS